MKHIQVLLPAFLVTLVLAGCNPFAQKMDYNLDVEELSIAQKLPVEWGLDNIIGEGIPSDSTLQAFRVDSVVKQHGKYSLLMDWRASYGEWTCCSYAINKRFKGKTIKLTGYLKTENADSGAGLWIRISGVGGRTQEFDNMNERRVRGTTDWKEYCIELPYNGEGSSGIAVGALIFNTGKVWMDNLHITIDGKDISKAEEFDPREKYKAARDTVFLDSSGIRSVSIHDGNIRALTNLGMIWGFIKYHHELVCRGEFNMDAELFRVLPKVLAAQNNNAANVVLEQWVDGFGKHPAYDSLIPNEGNVKIMPDYARLFDPDNLPPTLQKKLAFIRDNQRPRRESYYVTTDKKGSLLFRNEGYFSKRYYPDAGVRLLALYRYWNMVQYFCPNKRLAGDEWSNVLTSHMVDICKEGDAVTYETACLKLASRLRDSYAALTGSGQYTENLKGKYYLPFEAMFVEGKLMIGDIMTDAKDVTNVLRKGDIVEEIDNVPIDSLVSQYLPITPGTRHEIQLRDLAAVSGSLMRTYKKGIALTINRNGTRRKLPIRTLILAEVSLYYNAKEPVRYKMLADNVGYINAIDLRDADFERITDTFSDARGIVIDLRSFSDDVMSETYGNWLKTDSTAFAITTSGSIDKPGQFVAGKPKVNGGKGTKHYKGQVIILVNEKTEGTSELQAMALASAPGAKVVGSATTGAIGDMMLIMLPGNVYTAFCANGVQYPDGTETQRKGVRLDKEVKPTINGIREGRDEVLEVALKMLKG